MIRFTLFIIGMLMIGEVQSQISAFRKHAYEIIQEVDIETDIELLSPSSEEYDFLQEGDQYLISLFLAQIKMNSRSRPDELKQSGTLTSLAGLATKYWKGSQYSNAKKWKKLSKHFKRAASKSSSRFNIMKEVSFRIRLVDNHSRRFYYDRNGEEGALNLYSGKKPRSTSGLTEEELAKIKEPVPLNFFSEEEITKRFLKEIRRKSLLSDLKKGYYAYVGISVEIDEQTLHRNRLPTARVVVVLGARRLRNVKVKSSSKK